MVSSICGRSLLPRKAPQLLPLLQHLSSRQTATAGLLRPQLFPQQLVRNASKKASSSSAPKAAKKKTPDAVKKKPILAAAPLKIAPPLAAAPKYFSLAEQLGNSGKKKILLYACNNRLFVVGCYGLAAGMIAWSVYTFKTNIANRRPGIPEWVVKTTYVSISIMMVLALGVAYYPTRLIQVIHAHPIPATTRSPASVSITLHRRPILPTLPMKKIEIASPDLISLGEPLQSIGVLKAAPAAETQVQDTRNMVTKIKHGVTGAPFKAFDFFRSALSTSGFVLLRAEGEGKFRLSKDGWVWEKRGLDLLFKQAR
ncbi:uncharacterized protein LAJ45_00599 [Morchella importuna]|uniref:Uncharacterized protein n=1 Tax=Morchella conica CCBAS932 TaxID=1392247 RepID=A0A3N4L0P4_9PEZI|nr:uncharacterized protein LAJ45_00599 [Morchella importuna]KAH8155589.1 hypothetical protein LAJ45_00599 [Morchella importuna]RPB16377.1 hypothetical protein P167DRAFT_562347 [Morchella conica CCBAS932]